MSLKDSDRRSMLRFLGEEKYDEVMGVLGSFPSITMETKLQGKSKKTPPPYHCTTEDLCHIDPASFLYLWSQLGNWFTYL